MTLLIHIFIATLLSFTSGAQHYEKLSVTQDVTLERATTNYNYLPFLIVGTHPGFPMKRSLLQFNGVSSKCAFVISAELKLYFLYAHKASYMTDAQVPSFPRVVVAHQVLKPWSESTATSTKRTSTAYWSQQWLGFGSDVDPYSIYAATITVTPPNHWYSIDVTGQVDNWKILHQPNYGLLIRATNEQVEGRDFRFASNAYSDASKHAYIEVLCQTGRTVGGRISPIRPGTGETPQ